MMGESVNAAIVLAEKKPCAIKITTASLLRTSSEICFCIERPMVAGLLNCALVAGVLRLFSAENRQPRPTSAHPFLISGEAEELFYNQMDGRRFNFV